MTQATVMKRTIQVVCAVLVLAVSFSLICRDTAAASLENPQSGSVGLQGVVASKPPAQAATITSPVSGQHITDGPVSVSGLCPKGLLVEIFSNNIFVGSVFCADGRYTLSVSLFEGRNDLVARVFDALDQRGPDSNVVSVTFERSQPAKSGVLGLAVTSAYARRGINPGQTLSWPLGLSGGTGPYAISIDWGDGASPTLMSRQLAGDLEVNHAYDKAGIYVITIRAADSGSSSAYLQLVGQVNGAVTQSQAEANGTSNPVQKSWNWVWWSVSSGLVLTVASFWGGRKYELAALRKHIRRQMNDGTWPPAGTNDQNLLK